VSEKLIRELLLMAAAAAVLITDVLGSTELVIRFLAVLVVGFVAVSRIDRIDVIIEKEKREKDG